MAKSKKDTKAAGSKAADKPRLSAHPKARRQIRAVKGWSGLGTFLLVLYLALNAGLPAFDAGLRALAAGLAAYVVGWMIALVVWRQVAVAEVEEFGARMAAKAGDGHGATS